jgi:4-hydroxy-4-methyl-2-oxoglutarate aldolase
MTDESLLRRLSHVDPASLCDAGPELRVLPPELRPLRPGAHLVGRALTADAGEDLMSVLAALRQGGPGDVLVVATGGAGRAVAGELFATEALRRGMAGFVIDGFCRDRSTLATLPLPIYARGTFPRAAPAQGVPRVQVTVHIGDITISPGDLLVGDDDGIVVGTEARMLAAVAGAEAIHAREAALRTDMSGGVSLFDRVTFGT